MKVYNFNQISDTEYIEIAHALQSGSLIIYPTETIYGIGCNADIDSAVKSVFNVKKRLESKSFIYLFKDIEMLLKYASFQSEVEKTLVHKYWPGGMTIILKKNSLDGCVACRISSHPFLKKLFLYIDFPLISTSANFSDEPYNPDVDNIKLKFSDAVDILIQDDALKSVVSSTIVKVVSDKVEIVREGLIKIEV